MKNRAALLLVILTLVRCREHAGEPAATATGTTDTTTSTQTGTAEKTTAEKAFDAGMRARKKAEAIKAEEAKRAAEADAVADQ